MIRNSKTSWCVLIALALFAMCTDAVAEDSLLSDVNGDGIVGITALGDSLTYGVGDGLQPGADVPVIEESGAPRGYPKRLTALLNLSVRNAGVPGEELVAQGVWRIPEIVTSSRVDTMLLMEGTNDAVKQVSRGDFARAVQRAINVTRAAGKQIVVATLPQPTQSHQSLTTFTESYSAAVRELASINDVRLADVETLWRSTCPALEACELYNLPEGLHPNKKGYDALTQIFAAALLDIDLLSPAGPAELEAALGLESGGVIVKPPTSGAN